MVTPLPYLKELPNFDKDIIILDFDLKNLKDVVKKIKSLKSQNKRNVIHYGNTFQDNYDKYLYKSKSKYEEMKKFMKKIKVKVQFKDMKHNNVIRKVGEEMIEDNDRADDLIARGFCLLVEDIIEKKVEVEHAVKEEKKEKAIKEKAVKKIGKK